VHISGQTFDETHRRLQESFRFKGTCVDDWLPTDRLLGRTTVKTVEEWLKNGLPKDLEQRMKAAYDVAKPIERVESELVAQGLLNGDLDAFLNPDFSITASITTLRDATDVLAVRTELMARVKKEFLQNVASGLEGVERRLKESI
jgi:hypothetical protein